MKPITSALIGASIVLLVVYFSNHGVSWSEEKMVEPYFAGVEGVTIPVQKKKITPEYPKMALSAFVEANVILRAVIKTDGTVTDITPMKIDIITLEELESAFRDEAIKAVKKWRYKPAKLNGKPVDVYMTVIVKFYKDES